MITFKIKNEETRLVHLKVFGKILFLETSILGPLLFNIFLSGFFLEYGNNYCTNYADNTKIHIADQNTKELLIILSALAQKQYKHGWLIINRKRTMTNVICF